jgi:hypothetical protein
MTILRRSLRDVKTHAGAVGTASNSKSRHAVCLKIACLELEKERLGTEKQNALSRVLGIDARLREIDEQARGLVRLLDGVGGVAASVPDASNGAAAGGRKDERRTFRY